MLKILKISVLVCITLMYTLFLTGCASYGPYYSYSSGHYYYYHTSAYPNYVGWYPGDPYAGTAWDFNGF